MRKINPLTRLKEWLSAAIDWRVRDEFKSEHQVVSALSNTLAHVSSELTEQVKIQSALIEDLQKRVANLENSKAP